MTHSNTPTICPACVSSSIVNRPDHTHTKGCLYPDKAAYDNYMKTMSDTPTQDDSLADRYVKAAAKVVKQGADEWMLGKIGKTPTIDEQIDEILNEFATDNESDLDTKIAFSRTQLKALLIEQRIDELDTTNRNQFSPEHTFGRVSWAVYYKNRRAALKESK